MQPVRLLAGLCLLLTCSVLAAQESAPAPIWRVLPQGQVPEDARLKAARTYQDAYHPWTPPETKAAWEAEIPKIREQMLVSNGLWPMLPSTPLKAEIYGKIEKDDYTIEKVVFASLPGHYVTGSLYRPKNITGKVPGILCPHGHWANGRFYGADDKAAAEQIQIGAEKFDPGAHYPLQARMVGLARMGCTVFHYDMVGYADSKLIAHRAGFLDAEAELRLQNFMGLQTYNSLRALDFITGLPEVDPLRIGVTGASGGGTQTFMLCAIDPRPAAAFPAVMVSTAMQGGCICENTSYLRTGINNIAIAALFAPKPLAMSGADDWTIEIETKGLPELRQIYGLYGAADMVQAKAWPEFKHNYNQVAREMMYNWFNAHLGLDHAGPITEREFVPVPPAELSVWDDAHPVPADAADADGVRKYLTQVSDEQFAALLPKDAAGLTEYRRIVGTAARVMIDLGLPPVDDLIGVEDTLVDVNGDGYRLLKMVAGRKSGGERIPLIVLAPPDFDGTAVIWITEQGKQGLFTAEGTPIPAVKKLLDSKRAVIGADLFQTGEFLKDGEAPVVTVNEAFAGYTFGYNRPIVAERVRDILTVLATVRRHERVTRIELVGTGSGGVWALLARGLAGDTIAKTVVDLNGFGFGKLKATNDPNFLPGGLKYGGIGGIAALAAPAELVITGTAETPEGELKGLNEVYRVTEGKLTLVPASATPDETADLLLK